MVKQIGTEIEIKAPAAKVWDVLADFDRYGDWNPFIKSISGDMSEGSRLRVTMQPVGGKPMTFRPTVLKTQVPHEFRWLGHLFVPGLFDGEHYFQIEEISEDTVRFIQGERFRGILVPLLWGSMESGTLAGFKAMNKALNKKLK